MKKPMDYVYRFCNKHPNFGIPNLMKYIVGGNVVFWLLSLVNPVLMSYLSFSPAAILHGQVWRLISSYSTPSALIFSLVRFLFLLSHRQHAGALLGYAAVHDIFLLRRHSLRDIRLHRLLCLRR